MQKTISPKKYSNILHSIEIRRISFVDISSHFYIENFTAEAITVDSTNDVKIEIDEASKLLAAFDSYSFRAMVGDKELFTISLKLMVVFESRSKPNEEFLRTFEQNTLKVITYPYVRHAVQDLTSKMGLEPLILPMWRVPAKADKEFLKTSPADK